MASTVDTIARNGLAERVQITVRKAEAADAPALAELRWRWRGGAPDDDTGERAAFVAFFAAWVVDNLATHVPFLVEVDRRPAGMAWLNLTTRVPSVGLLDRRAGDIQAVFVEPESRDSGVGSALLAAILADARERGLEHVSVHSSDRAIPFYLRGGFAVHNWLHWEPTST